MGQLNEVRPGDLDEMNSCLEDIYGGAYWALRYGATREDILAQIDEAVEMYQETQLMGGRIMGLDADVTGSESSNRPEE